MSTAFTILAAIGALTVVVAVVVVLAALVIFWRTRPSVALYHDEMQEGAR